MSIQGLSNVQLAALIKKSNAIQIPPVSSLSDADLNAELQKSNAIQGKSGISSNLLSASKSRLNSVKNLGSDLEYGINRVGSDIGTGIGEGVGNLRELLGFKDPGTQLMAQGVNTVAKAENIPQNTADRALISTVPYLATAAATGGTSIPEEMIAQGLTGAFVNPNDRLQSGLEMAVLPGVLSGITKGSVGLAKGMPRIVKGLYGKFLNQEGIKNAGEALDSRNNELENLTKEIQVAKNQHAQTINSLGAENALAKQAEVGKNTADEEHKSSALSFVKSLTNGEGLGNPEVMVGRNINNNYTNKLQEAKKKYADSFETAKNEGRNLVPLSDFKPMANKFKKLPEDEQALLPAIFNNNKGVLFAKSGKNGIPIEKIHEAQGELGRLSSKYSNMFLGGSQNAARARNITTLQTSLQGILKKAMGKNASKKYADATDFFRESIVPYQKVSSTLERNNPLNFTGISRKFSNIDTDTNLTPDMKTILSHGGDSLKDKIVSANLSGAAEATPSGVDTINPDKLFKLSQQTTPKRLKHLVTKRFNKNFGNLEAKKVSLEEANRKADFHKRNIADLERIEGRHSRNLDRLMGRQPKAAALVQKATDKLEKEKLSNLSGVFKKAAKLVGYTGLVGLAGGSGYKISKHF